MPIAWDVVRSDIGRLARRTRNNAGRVRNFATRHPGIAALIAAPLFDGLSILFAIAVAPFVGGDWIGDLDSRSKLILLVAGYVIYWHILLIVFYIWSVTNIGDSGSK